VNGIGNTGTLHRKRVLAVIMLMTLKLTFRRTVNLCTPWDAAVRKDLASIKVLAGFCIRTGKAVAVIPAAESWDVFISVVVRNVGNNLTGEYKTLNYVLMTKNLF
jgi:hypothetical protein